MGIRIGGFQAVSLIDYPGVVASVIFTQGCNFRCPYCHNPELVYPEVFRTPLAFTPEWLKVRQKLVDGVVITGGEPTLQEDLPEFIAGLKKLGLKVKLDTNGSNPKMLKGLLKSGMLDYVAMDVKASKDKYQKMWRSDLDYFPAVWESIDTLLAEKRASVQFRCTYDTSLLSPDDLFEIQTWLPSRRLIVQKCNS